ncbi:MAG: transposase [Verrucomicrobia bacterium]|nr:transposase [Verrucomicrobiota bacterium]
MKDTLPEDEAACFIDGVHPTHNTKPAYGWTRKGERKEIQTNTGRQRLNLTGAIDISSRRVVFQEDSTLNFDATISFLKMLESAYPNARKVHVFCDNADILKIKMSYPISRTQKLTCISCLPTALI